MQNRNFVGCVRDVSIDRKLLDLNDFIENNNTKPGCENADSFCGANSCKNRGEHHRGTLPLTRTIQSLNCSLSVTSGTCSDEWGGFKCDCVEGFGGKDCSDQIDVTQQLSGDGYLLFGRHPLVQFPWFVGMSFRTRDVSARLLSVAISNDRSVRLEVSL